MNLLSLTHCFLSLKLKETLTTHPHKIQTYSLYCLRTVKIKKKEESGMKGGAVVAPLSHSLSSFVPVASSLNCSALFPITRYSLSLSLSLCSPCHYFLSLIFFVHTKSLVHTWCWNIVACSRIYRVWGQWLVWRRKSWTRLPVIIRQ